MLTLYHLLQNAVHRFVDMMLWTETFKIFQIIFRGHFPYLPSWHHFDGIRCIEIRDQILFHHVLFIVISSLCRRRRHSLSQRLLPRSPSLYAVDRVIVVLVHWHWIIDQFQFGIRSRSTSQHRFLVDSPCSMNELGLCVVAKIKNEAPNHIVDVEQRAVSGESGHISGGTESKFRVQSDENELRLFEVVAVPEYPRNLDVVQRVEIQNAEHNDCERTVPEQPQSAREWRPHWTRKSGDAQHFGVDLHSTSDSVKTIYFRPMFVENECSVGIVTGNAVSVSLKKVVEESKVSTVVQWGHGHHEVPVFGHQPFVQILILRDARWSTTSSDSKSESNARRWDRGCPTRMRLTHFRSDIFDEIWRERDYQRESERERTNECNADYESIESGVSSIFGADGQFIWFWA